MQHTTGFLVQLEHSYQQALLHVHSHTGTAVCMATISKRSCFGQGFQQSVAYITYHYVTYMWLNATPRVYTVQWKQNNNAEAR